MEKITYKGLPGGFIVYGRNNKFTELLAASDIFTLPSYREGLPRSIIEAMAMGKPIVATNIRGCREEVFEGFVQWNFR